MIDLHACSIFDTDRLIIRHVTMKDAPAIFALRSDAEAMRFVDITPYENIDRAEAFISQVMNDMAQSEAIFWVIIEKISRTMIGTVCLWSFSQSGDKAEIGSELLPAFQKRGYMTEAMNVIIPFAFHTLGLSRIEAIAHEDHAASRRLLEKFGFTSLGRAHDCYPDSYIPLTMQCFVLKRDKEGDHER